MVSLHRFVFTLAGILAMTNLMAQMVPANPSSYIVYSPFLVNPAISGSKDFSNINLIARVNGTPGAQMATYNGRLPGKTVDGVKTHSGFGLGGFFYNDEFMLSRNLGFGVSGAYHISLDQKKLSNLAIGAAFRGHYNLVSDEGESTTGRSSGFTPNVDVGLYYYGPSAYAGISSTNLLGTSDSTLAYGDEAYIPREYNFYGGYKFLLSRKNGIVLEPSLLISLNDSTLSEIGQHITPYLKLYMQNFYFGTYVKDFDFNDLAFFFQYQFPWFYTGLLVEFPREGFLTDDNILLELCLGINLGLDKEAFRKSRHW